jgi:hypothetical protein
MVVPLKLRVLGLMANFLANGVLLYGVVGYFTNGTRLLALLAGGAVTLLSIVLLSRPPR